MVTASEEVVRRSYVQWALEIINEAAQDYIRYEDYYIGDHKLEFATDRWKDVFGNEFEEFSDNWCQVVVDSPVQRLEIDGWDVDGKPKGDVNIAEDIWDDNNLQVEADDLHTQAFVKGDAYLIVWKNPDDPDNKIDIFYNDAVDVAVVYDGANRRRIARGAKRFQDTDGQWHLVLYYPDRIEKWISPRNQAVNQEALWHSMNDFSDVPQGWQLDGPQILNPYGIVPIFHFKNRASGRTHGVSELKPVIPVQNAVNKLLMDLMVGSEFGSFRQKWMAGAGHPKDGWKSGASRIWATTDANAKFGEFGQIDLEPLVKAIDLVVGHVAKITQTPLHYLRSSGDMPSGEAMKTSESGLVKKCLARQKTWGATWSAAMTFAVRLMTGEEPKQKLIPIWQSPETRHDLEQAQTAQLKSVLGIPLRQLWSEHFGYSEEQVKEFEKENRALAASVLASVIAQAGQLPPGAEQVTATPEQLVQLLQQAPAIGNRGEGQGLDVSQILALLPKGVTAQTTAGESTTKPQPNSRPPASPTRRSSGFKD